MKRLQFSSYTVNAGNFRIKLIIIWKLGHIPNIYITNINLYIMLFPKPKFDNEIVSEWLVMVGLRKLGEVSFQRYVIEISREIVNFS